MGASPATAVACARRRRKRDERQRPTQRAVTPAGGEGPALTGPPPPTIRCPRLAVPCCPTRARVSGCRRTLCRDANDVASSVRRAPSLSLQEAAERVGVPRPRCAAGSTGADPQYEGDWTPRRGGPCPGGGEDARARPLARRDQQGHRGGPAGVRLPGGPVPARPGAVLAQAGGHGDRARAGAGRARRQRARAQPRAGRDDVRGRAAAAALRRRGALGRAFRWSPCSSSSASTDRRWRRSPTPRSGCSISTCTSR